MRPFRFAIHLQEFGWKPTVLTIAAPGQELTPRESELLRDVEIIEIESPIDRTVKSESQLGVAAPRRSGRTGSGVRLLQTLDRQFPIDTWMLLFLARYGRLSAAVRRVNPHVIWATGDPWSSLVIGRRLARRFQIPFFADFRDPWTLSQIRTSGQWKASRAADRFFERQVVRDADVVIFQSPLVEERYRSHYAKLRFPSRTITNSFDPRVFRDAIDLETATPYPVSDRDGLTIGFFGKFRTMSPAVPIADVLRAAHRLDSSTARAVEIHSFGPLSEDDAEYVADSGIEGQFRTRRPVPLERALSVLRTFDILLLSTEASRTEIIPAKIFEYLAAGRPILALTNNPAIDSILQRTGTGVQISDPRKAAELIVACERARREGSPLPIRFAPKPDEIQRFEAKRTTQLLAETFDSVVEPHSNARIRR